MRSISATCASGINHRCCFGEPFLDKRRGAAHCPRLVQFRLRSKSVSFHNGFSQNRTGRHLSGSTLVERAPANHAAPRPLLGLAVEALLDDVVQAQHALVLLVLERLELLGALVDLRLEGRRRVLEDVGL